MSVLVLILTFLLEAVLFTLWKVDGAKEREAFKRRREREIQNARRNRKGLQNV